MSSVAPRFLLGVLASFVLASCASENGSNEQVDVASAPLDAYCQANVNGVGMVDTETDYLPHVVHCENGGAPLESLKAQAVAARTYLYYKMKLSGSINDGAGDQTYSCSSGPTADDIAAVADTSGIVLEYQGAPICSFFVAGANSTPPACMGDGSDPTNTEQYVTYNQGLSGSNINQTTLGFVDPTNYANRGCFSQLGSRCLANLGDTYDTILQFYYGDDIEITQATGACISATLSDGGPIIGPDGGIALPAPSRGDGSSEPSSGDGSSLNEKGCGCDVPGARAKSPFEALFGVGLFFVGVTRRRKK